MAGLNSHTIIRRYSEFMDLHEKVLSPCLSFPCLLLPYFIIIHRLCLYITWTPRIEHHAPYFSLRLLSFSLPSLSHPFVSCKRSIQQSSSIFHPRRHSVNCVQMSSTNVRTNCRPSSKLWWSILSCLRSTVFSRS